VVLEKFHEKLSRHRTSLLHRTVLTGIVHDDNLRLRFCADAQRAFTSFLRVRGSYHALDPYASYENEVRLYHLRFLYRVRNYVQSERRKILHKREQDQQDARLFLIIYFN